MKQIKDVATKAAELRRVRRETMLKHGKSLRGLYRIMEETPENTVSKFQDKLDATVFDAYGMKKDEDVLAFLLRLNLQLAEKEAAGEKIVGPGLPPIVRDAKEFISDDCISAPQ